jgi:hypothetical protein
MRGSLAFRSTAGSLILLGAWANTAFGALAPLPSAPRIQEAGLELTPVPVRVIQSSPGGLLEIDRGELDGLRVGDRLVFSPRSSGTVEGRVLEVEERTAAVELLGSLVALPSGTRGEAWIPRERLQPSPGGQANTPPVPVAPLENADGSPAKATPNPAETGAGQAPPASKPAWQRIDDYQAGQPLLSGLERVRPADRPRSYSGRVWLAMDQIVTDLDGRGDGFYRLGSALRVDNSFGQGGSFEWQGDLSLRRSFLPDQPDEEQSLLRVERLAYRLGGDRHSPDAFALGRFLQHVPELGLLDGGEWFTRSDSGDRYGASLGFLPQPNPELDTGEDLALAGFYEWQRDSLEDLSATVAYQKTFHNLVADRDLLVLRARYLPRNGWKVFLSSLIDFYTSGDEGKNAVELSQAQFNLWRDFERHGLRLRGYSQRFPQIDGDLVPTTTLEQIQNAHTERASLDMWVGLGPHGRLLAEGGAWIDEEDDGVDAAAALEFQELYSHSDRWRLGAFLTQGKFTDVLGWRASTEQPFAGGTARLAYEYAWQDLVGFLDENDDLPQQRLSFSQDWYTSVGWSLTARADWVLLDEDHGLWLGFFFQQAF